MKPAAEEGRLADDDVRVIRAVVGQLDGEVSIDTLEDKKANSNRKCTGFQSKYFSTDLRGLLLNFYPSAGCNKGDHFAPKFPASLHFAVCQKIPKFGTDGKDYRNRAGSGGPDGAQRLRNSQ